MTSSNRKRLFPALISSILFASGCQCEAVRDAYDGGSLDGSIDADPQDVAVDANDGAVSGSSFLANRFALVLALGEAPDGFTHVRVDQRLWCRSEMRNARAAIVDALGVSMPLELACSRTDEPTSLRAELPGPGPFWLVMVHEPMPDRPQWLHSSAVSMWTLDEVAFEP